MILPVLILRSAVSQSPQNCTSETLSLSSTDVEKTLDVQICVVKHVEAVMFGDFNMPNGNRKQIECLWFIRWFS